MYTYAFFKTPDLALTLPCGIAGAVQIIGNAQISALVEPTLNLELVQQDDQQLVQAVLTHDRVICDLFWQTAILPLRFGTWFASLDSLLAHLTTNQSVYLLKLTQLAGKAEYLLKLVPQDRTEAPLAPDLKGKDYFLAKKQLYVAQVAAQTQQAQQLDQLLALIRETYPLHYHHAVNADGPPADHQKIYLLIDCHHEADLCNHLQQWQDRSAHWKLTLGDALPPYHFVSD